MHSNNTVTQLQQWKTLLRQHKVKDIFAINWVSCILVCVSLRVDHKSQKLQSSYQYLLLLLDSSPWVKATRCGYQEDWQQNQQWVVKMLCATLRHCFDAAVVFDLLYHIAFSGLHMICLQNSAFIMVMWIQMHGMLWFKSTTEYKNSKQPLSRCTCQQL